MNPTNKNIVLGHLLDYFRLKNIPMKKSGKTLMLNCPVCNAEPHTANKIPNVYRIHCFKCKKSYDLIDISRHVDHADNASDEVVIHHLKELLNINITTKTDEKRINTLLDFYESNAWALIAIAANSKAPVQAMKNWNSSEYREKTVWESWLTNKCNLAARTGKVSNITVIDIDVLLNKEKSTFRFKELSEKKRSDLLNKRVNGLKVVYDELGSMLGEPLVQENLGGKQLFYQYEEDLPKTQVDINGIHVDIENNGGYVLIEPSVLGVTNRKFESLNNIPKMSDELKKFLLSKVTVPRKTASEQVREDIDAGFNLGLLKEGERNAGILRLLGLFRKQLSLEQTKHVAYILNNALCQPMLSLREIRAMINSLDSYVMFEEKELSHEVLKYLQSVEEAPRTEIAMAVVGTNRGEDKKRIDAVLKHLVKEEKINKHGYRYEVVEDMDWQDTFLDLGIPVNFKVPYLYDVAHFNFGDLVILGGQNKVGKSTISMNIIAQLVKQGIKPYYAYSESGGRFSKTALKLGLKETDFWRCACFNPEQLILKPGAVTVFDWVQPTDFARTADLFRSLVEKTEKAKGFMIALVQLREDGTFFAKDQISQFPALVCKYLYDKGGHGEFGSFHVSHIRDPKINVKSYEIPCKFVWESSRLVRVDELERRYRHEKNKAKKAEQKAV